MNRRSFLKFLPAGVVGVRQAAAEAAEKLALGDGRIGGLGYMDHDTVGELGPMGWGGPTNDRAVKDLKRLLDPEWLKAKRETIQVRSLDPDIACMKSMSLSVRIQIQKDRLLARHVERERSILEKIIAGALG